MSGRAFFKMTGSGNDFVVLDARDSRADGFGDATVVRRLCARGTGVGADGLVMIVPAESADFRMVYFNSDGSRAEMCGNAALCVTRLAAQLGAASAAGMRFESDSGVVTARLGAEGLPEIDLAPPTDVRPDVGFAPAPGEKRIGFAEVGVPHLVVLCGDVENIDVQGRGAALRHDSSLPKGANVNFVSRAGEGWRIRTFERGVEGETLACGTGAAATAILLASWGEAGETVILITRSGSRLAVRLAQASGGVQPSLSGEGRLVFRGRLEEI